jgi:hypothetical protein
MQIRLMILSPLRGFVLLAAFPGLKPRAILWAFNSAFRLALRARTGRVVSLRSAPRDFEPIFPELPLHNEYDAN